MVDKLKIYPYRKIWLIYFFGLVAAALAAAVTLNQPSALTDDWNFDISPAELSLYH